MRKLLALVVVIAAMFAVVVASATAGNPSGTGPPSQTCLSSTAPNEPGNAANSPGSPFNETSGKAGMVYSEKSQYDVACYQVSSH
jgi:hypothetical protein